MVYFKKLDKLIKELDELILNEPGLNNLNQIEDNQQKINAVLTNEIAEIKTIDWDTIEKRIFEAMYYQPKESDFKTDNEVEFLE